MINNVTIMGRLTVVPELRTTGNGVEVTSFCVAVDRSYQKQGEEKQTDFINCVAWRQTAVFVTKYFGKGDMIAITGSIQTRKYDDKDGKTRTAVEVLANNVSFCGAKTEKTNPVSANVSANESDFEEIIDDDDMPF